MFTIKLYSNYESGIYHRQRIFSAESFTVLRLSDGCAEITLHQKNQNDDSRVDIEWEDYRKAVGFLVAPPVFQKAVIENAAGRTTEIIVLGPDQRKVVPRDDPRKVVAREATDPPGMRRFTGDPADCKIKEEG